MTGWHTACPDWKERLLAGASLVPDLPLFKEEAARALRVFKRLRIPDLHGRPTMAEACGPWFFPIVAALFGSYDPATNRRAIQEIFELIPKKNAKSSNGGAVMVTALIVNRRPAAEFQLIAPTKEISGIAFKQASGTIKADPELTKLFHIQDHLKRITHRQTEATLQIRAADTDVITGGKSLGTMIDETHVFAKHPRAADVFLELRGALAARPDGFLFQTTTQSKEPPAGVFKQELDLARKVRDGLIDLPLLPVLYELPDDVSRDGGWKERRYWPLVNPNLGRSVDEAFLARELLKAEETGPEALALLASQHFNVEIGLALRSDRWAGADHWQAAADTSLTLETLLARSEVVVVGIDGGGLDDLLGLAVIGREAESRRWLVWTKTWAFPIVLERRKSEAPRIRDFAQAGELSMPQTMGDDVGEVADLVEQIAASGLLPEKAAIGVDTMGIGQIVDELAERGIGTERIVGIQQGWKLSGAIKTAERKLADGSLKHAGQALMAWNVGNAKLVPRGNAVTIEKQTSGSAKIDTLMALFNAVALMSLNPQAQRSVFELLAAAGDAQPGADEAIDYAALQDVHHPLFAEMKKRFEKLQDTRGDDD